MILVSSLACESNEVYIKVTKMSKAYASEESFKIRSGTTVVAQRSSFVNQKEESFEYCLPQSANNQYELELRDSANDAWTAGAWLSISGLYGNLFFKNMMVAKTSEVYPLSLYYAVTKDVEWKMSSTVTDAWTTYSYDDNAWTSITLGSETPSSASGTQFFRKQFTGLSGMAAYEARLNYRYGIVAYINGVEVFRDNMPAGTVTSETLALGGYNALSFRGFIRPGSEVSGTQCVLAVSLHYTAAGENSIDFNAYVAMLTASTQGANCFIASEEVTYTSSPMDPKNAFDFNMNTHSDSAVSAAAPVDIAVSFRNLIPYVNGIRIWPSTSPAKSPTAFTWSGKASDTELSQIFAVSKLHHVNSVDSFAFGYFNAGLYKNYVMHITAAGAATMSLYEVQPLVCTVTLPESIEFGSTTYSLIVTVEEAVIFPTLSEFRDCTLTPALPAGMTFSASTCSVSGVPTAELASTVFTMTSTIGQNSFTGTFTLQVSGCDQTLVDLRRVYFVQSSSEYFSVKNSANEVVYSIQASTTQTDYATVHTYLCLPQDEYTVTLQGTNQYWASFSLLYADVLYSPTEREVIFRSRYDGKLGISTASFSTKYPILPASQWFYKMNEVPANWFGSETAGWTQSTMGSYPDATNTIQLYKKTFTVANLDSISGVVLNLRYKFGCVVYLNSHEVFRNGVVGTLSTSSVAENIYPELMYRVVSLPVVAPSDGTNPVTTYVQQGSNTIAIAIVSTLSTKMSFFDCALRLMGTVQENRALEEYTVTSQGISGADHFFEECDNFSLDGSTCTNNWVAVQFNNDRREWINSVIIQLRSSQDTLQPRSVTIQARNGEEEWVTLRALSSMVWSQQGQSKKVWFFNRTPYNQYRFKDFSPETNDCAWSLGRIAFLSSSISVDVPALKYVEEGESVSVYKDIEMAEVYPSSDAYLNYSVHPALPAGIHLDAGSGMISGTATAFSDLVTYTITAMNIRGESSTTTLPLRVSICTGEQGLITLVVRTEEYPVDGYKLHQGKTTQGAVLASVGTFPVSGGLFYADWCLPNDIYVVEVTNNYDMGWMNPAGYYLTVDVGAIKFETSQVWEFEPSVTTLFSSYLPFQAEYSEWSVFKGKDVDANWKNADFDASAWESVKAAAIGTNSEITTYVRREFAIPSLEDYSVLNVRVKYAGGVVAYFNGRKVARFNLAEDFSAETQSLEAKNEPVFSVFHVILSIMGATTDKNVMAFEVHRPLNHSSSEPVVFDATGVFGVSECSIALDSYSFISEGHSDFFDLSPVTYGSLPNAVGASMEWTVENQEGTRFNSYAWQIASTVSNWGFSLYGRISAEDDYTSAIALTGQNVDMLRRKSWDVPVGLIGFRDFKYVTDVPAAMDFEFSSNFFQYCRSSGATCPGIEEYPSVSEGQISPASCEAGFRGYAYRVCENGVLGDVKTDMCEYKVPDNLAYAKTEFTFVQGLEASTGLPTYDNIVLEFEVNPSTPLPEGLQLDNVTGLISGKPVNASEGKYVIYGVNPKGRTLVELIITVRKAYCYAEDVFPQTEAGEVATYECSSGGNYIGTRTRACVLGTKDGEWQKAAGVCVSLLLIIVVVVIVIVVIVVIVLVAVKVSQKKKAVKGVKGGKGAKGKTMKASTV